MENTTNDLSITNNTSTIHLIAPTDTHNLVLWAIIDTILMVVIIGANILTICALRISRKLANLISNHFICSLAFSDLMVGLMLPYHLAFYISEDLGKCKYTCLLRFIMIVLACCASVYNLLAIALDRYIAIVHPLHYNRCMIKRVVFTIISIGWGIAITLAATTIYWNNWNPEEFTSVEYYCELYYVLPKNYVVFVLTPSFLSIWVAMLVLYWRIWKEARDHTKRMKSVTHTNGPPNNDWKSVQVVLLILGCFSICWLPYFIVILTIKLYELEGSRFYEPAFTLAMANSGINPCIYAWKNKGFRRAFLRLLKCKNPNLSENHFSYNYTRKASKPVEVQNKIVNGVCNGTEEYVLQSELNAAATVKNKLEQCNNNEKPTTICTIKEIDEKVEEKPLSNGDCKVVEEKDVCKDNTLK